VKRLISALLFTALAGGISGSAQPQRCAGAIDPVCGLCVEKNPKLSHAYKGETYYFCLTRDLEIFKTNPAKWVK
jgi:YHS domain-containing protein